MEYAPGGELFDVLQNSAVLFYIEFLNPKKQN